MEQLLEAFKNRPPEVVFEWNDRETEAKGWIVINSLRGGAAGGGTRMRKDLDRREVESLAKVMEIKFTVSGPAIGGAKSGINFDPSDPRRDGVLRRWFKAVMPILKHYYGTGGDLNVDEMKDVIPITEDFGLWHPQEGIVNGHYGERSKRTVQTIGQLRLGVSKKIEDPQYTPGIEYKLVVADMITGYGVAESVKHHYDVYRDEDLRGKRAIIQGWGNVAAAAGYYLARYGVKIVGIIDRNGGIVRTEGLDEKEVADLLVNRSGNQLHANDALPYQKVNEIIWDAGAEIFIPGAASRLVLRDQVERMIDNGLEVISCGANVPFADDRIFHGETAKWVDNEISLIPDFIANCGMARVFAFLMEKQTEISDEAIFSDVSHTIRHALAKSHARSASLQNIAATSLDIALRQLHTEQALPA